MTQLIETLLKNTNLSKNTTSIIIGYLTDPPRLPYLHQLIYTTRNIRSDVDTFYSYENYYFDLLNKRRHDDITGKIYKKDYGWCVSNWDT